MRTGASGERRWRAAPGLVLAALGVLAAACAGGPRAGDPAPLYAVSGAYVGSLVVEGERFDAGLVLRSDGGTGVRGTFRVGPPFDVEGEAEGVRIDELLRLTVTYRGSGPRGCDGRIEGILAVSERGALLQGPVTVADCAAELAGRMTFRR
ncbi:MAG: hypothetical protein WEB90_01090 [Gemmatimonadota bacterium]